MKDLYHYVNGPWLEKHVIPDDRGVDGTFHALRDRAESDAHEIVSSSEGLPGKLFSSFMDVAALNEAGAAPLDEDVEPVLAASSPAEFEEALGRLDREGVPSPLACWVEKDSDGSDSVLYIAQGGLGLPDEAYYREEGHAEVLKAYRAHVERMWDFLIEGQRGGASPAEAARRVVGLEGEIAAGHWDVVASRDAVRTYNPTPLGEIPAGPRRILTASGVPDGTVVAMMPSFLEHLDSLLTEERLDDWKLWAVWQALRARAGLLTEEISKVNFEFYGTALSGATRQRDRWKRGVGLAESYVGDEVGREFVSRHFPASSKEQMQELVGYLVAAYRERISSLSWMTEETRGRALAKLEKFQAKIGYPERFRDYSGLEFSPEGSELVANVRRGAAFSHDYELSKIGRPADRDEWVTTPQTVNAFYNPVVNDITFPAAILRPPFFDPEADPAENFGAIGAVIGHEIGHGFDDQGSRYDGDGNLDSWWTDEDRASFKRLTDRLVGQFDGLTPSVLKEQGSDAGVNGSFTLGENIGDLGGLGIAVVAYRAYLADQGAGLGDTEEKPFDAPDADPELAERSFSGLQRLFLAWARVWRTAIRPELAKQYLAIDPHAPAEFRCNVIAANIPEFYEAFPDVDESNPMFVPEAERVIIW